jgi:hypothetical protein
MARTASVTKAAKIKTSVPKSQVINSVPDSDSLGQVYRVTDATTHEEIIRYAELPGVVLEFDVVKFQKLDDDFVSMLPASAQKAYWLTLAEYEDRRKLADRAVYEATSVDPMSKLLDGPRGTANPLVRDALEVQRLAPEYYFTWRIEGGQGDLDSARRAGFRVMCRPKDEIERNTKSPIEWTGERWKIRDGTSDPISGDEIFNVMVYIRKQAWKDNLDAMSMVSHNAYSTNKKQFVEGVDNLSRDMLSAKERIQVADLDELHIEEHTLIRNGTRVQEDPKN